MDVSKLKSAILATDQSYKKLRCNYGVFIDHEFGEQAYMFYSDYFEIYSLYDLVWRNNFGQELKSRDISLKILDIGCGRGKKTESILYGNGKPERYVGVDIRLDGIETKSDDCKPEKMYICADAIAWDGWGLVDRDFNMIIIDVEPHGKEWEIYQRILHYCGDVHIIILSCIGRWTLQHLALEFLTLLDKKGWLVDYYWIPVINDVLVIVCKNGKFRYDSHLPKKYKFWLREALGRAVFFNDITLNFSINFVNVY